MARRTLSHKALRADFEAAERRKAEGTGETGESTDDAGPEASPKKTRKAAAPKEAKPKRTRTAKVIRQRAVWGVFSNSNARVQVFAYPQKQEADDYAKKMAAEKGSTFFVQLVKEPIEENKE